MFCTDMDHEGLVILNPPSGDLSFTHSPKELMLKSSTLLMLFTAKGSLTPRSRPGHTPHADFGAFPTFLV